MGWSVEVPGGAGAARAAPGRSGDTVVVPGVELGAEAGRVENANHDEDLLKTRPPGENPRERGLHGRPKALGKGVLLSADERDWGTREVKSPIKIQSLHQQWMAQPVNVVAHAKKVPEVTRKRKKPRRGRAGHPARNSQRKRKRHAGEVADSPRLLEPLHPRPSPPRMTNKDLESKEEEEGRRVFTPFARNVILRGPSNPKALKSFLVNFLNDDLGSFKAHVDLTQHARDSGHPITDATLQEMADIHPHVLGVLAEGCVEISDAGLWALARSCVSLEKLNFAGCSKITHIGLRSLALRCNALREISLKGCIHVTDLSLRVLAAGCKHLQSLNVADCSEVSDGGVVEVALCCKDLQFLSLENCSKLCKYGDRSLVELGKNCGDLRELNLSGCEFVCDPGIRAIAHGCPRLANLAIRGCSQITGVAVRSLARGCRELGRLYVDGCKQLTNGDLWTIGEGFPALELLSLESVISLRARGIRGLARLARSLRILNLAHCPRIDDEALVLLGNSMRELSQLDLSKNQSITNHGVENLCHGCTKLVYLNLGGCTRVTLTFLRSLCEDLPFVQCAPRDYLGLVPRPDAAALIEETEQMRTYTAAAVVIQKLVRGVAARGGVQQIRKAALRRYVVPQVQAIVRGYFARKHIRLERLHSEYSKATLLLQRHYRGHMGRKEAARRIQLEKIRLNHTHACTRIQACLRGWEARKQIARMRQFLAVQALRESEQRAIQEAMAVRIQCLFRRRKCRVMLFAMQQAQEEVEARNSMENRSATSVQCCWRKKRARNVAQEKRREARRREKELKSACLLQKAFRGLVGRRLARAARQTLRWQLEHKSAIVLQRAWRGHKGRQVGAIMKSFAHLYARETQAAVRIQTFWRGKQGARLLEFMRITRAREALRRNAATAIQRVFRGHKGREEWEVRVELKASSKTLGPLLQEESTVKQACQAARVKLEENLETANGISQTLKGLQKELSEVSKHKAEFYDSVNITGTLQRYRTGYLAHALVMQIEEQQAKLQKLQESSIDKLETDLRMLEKRLRLIAKKISPEDANKVFRIRQGRARRLYEKLRRKRDAAALIQGAFRSYRVRVAERLGGHYWQELEEGGYVKYYNARTEETTIQRPWSYWVLKEACTRGLFGDAKGFARPSDTKGGKKSPWTEYLDEATGLPFYCNCSTGEYRWERPLELCDAPRGRRESRSGGDELKRRTASGWLEYRGGDGLLYYYNEATQECTWDTPEGFNDEWLKSQDIAALTRRSATIRDASGWSEYEDPEGRRYFYNHETGLSQWETPRCFDRQWLSQHGDQVTARSIRTKDVGSEGWQELYDVSTGYTYYYNEYSGETRWSLSPQEAETSIERKRSRATKDPVSENSDALGETSAIDFHSEKGAATGEQEASSLPDLAAGVEEFTSENPDGHWLESQNELALTARSIKVENAQMVASPWQEMYDTESGYTYYWNPETGETSWDIDCVGNDRRKGADEKSRLGRSGPAGSSLLDQGVDETAAPGPVSSAEQAMDKFAPQLAFDDVLSEKLHRLCEREKDYVLFQEDSTYLESVQWLVQCLQAGELLSASNVVDFLHSHLDAQTEIPDVAP